MTWKKYGHFRSQEQFYFQLVNDGEDIHKEIEALCDMLSVAYNIDSKSLIEDFPLTIGSETSEDLIGFFFELGKEVSLLRMYAHVNTVISSYEPPIELFDQHEFKVVLEGEEYVLDVGIFEGVANGDFSLPTLDVVEVMHLQRRFASLVKEYENKFNSGEDEGVGKDEDGIKIGAGAFAAGQDILLGTEEMAVLLKKRGEKLPHKRSARLKFMRKRKKLFENMPFSVVADVRFFLTCILGKLAIIQTTKLSGKGSQELESSPKIRFERSEMKVV